MGAAAKAADGRRCRVSRAPACCPAASRRRLHAPPPAAACVSSRRARSGRLRRRHHQRRDRDWLPRRTLPLARRRGADMTCRHDSNPCAPRPGPFSPPPLPRGTPTTCRHDPSRARLGPGLLLRLLLLRGSLTAGRRLLPTRLAGREPRRVRRACARGIRAAAGVRPHARAILLAAPAGEAPLKARTHARRAPAPLA
eukprot:3406495-Prymnesium_polylepis.1